MSAMEQNKGKFVLIVVLLIAAGAVYWFTSSNRATLPRTLTYVDVTTGKVYSLPRGETRIPPVENPETGERTLVPCYRTDDGQLFVAGRMYSLIRNELKGVNQVVDPETLEVRAAP